MTVFVDAGGQTMGETVDYVPAGGVVVTSPPRIARALADASGDAAASSFNIQLDYSGGGLTASQQAIFAGAAARWEAILTGDLVDMGAVDDVKIYASGKPIDGVGTILGQAGYTALRSGSYLPYMGSMNFDSADLASMEANGSLLNVITHEMGHVLGVGSLWTKKSLIVDSGTAASRFVGANAVAEYARFIGNSNVSSIPIETDGGYGTADAHWDDATFGAELMTGYLSGGVNSLSRMTAASMIDMGYPLVNVDAADLYTMTNALPTIGALSATAAALGSPIGLSVASAADADGIGSVTFYRETNGIPGLQSTGTVTPDTAVAINAGANLATQASTVGLGVGTYTFYARAIDARGAYSAVAATTATIVNVANPPTPAAPDLATSSDTGDSAVDNLTSVNRPTFVGSAGALATVTLYVDGAVAGTTTAAATGAYLIAPTIALPDGTHSIKVAVTALLGTSAASSTLSVAIDTVGGTALRFSYDREWTQDVTVTFGDTLTASRLVDGSIDVRNLSDDSTIDMRIVAVNGTSVTLAADGIFSDGRYVLSLPSDSSRDAAGNPLTASDSFAFTQLYGDANNDGTVDFNDLMLLARHFGSTSGQSASTGNIDYSSDGAVGFSDLLLLARNFGTKLAASGVVTASAAPRALNLEGFVANATSAKLSRRSIYRATFFG